MAGRNQKRWCRAHRPSLARQSNRGLVFAIWREPAGMNRLVGFHFRLPERPADEHQFEVLRGSD